MEFFFKLSRKLTYLSFFFIFLIFINTDLQAEIKYKSVQAEGFGANSKEAIDMALSEALGKVNGKSIETENFLTTIENIEVTNNDENYYFSQEYQQKINEKTKGIVKSYEVIDKSVDSNGLLKVIVEASVIQYSYSTNSKRKRIAIIPFRIKKNKFQFDGNLVSVDRIQRLFSDSLISNLVQTRKFTVLDREYLSETANEKSLLLRDDGPIEDLAKLGRELFADYIIVGRIEDLGSELKQKKLLISNKTISYSDVVAEINYRIIDVPTKQIKFADAYTFNEGDKLDFQKGNIDQKLIAYTTDEISLKILNAIYPIKIEKISGKNVTLGMGGDLVIKGQIYDIILLGDKIVDTYTKEYLGREETVVGKIEITNVASKISSAKLIEENIEFKKALPNSSFIVRLNKENELSGLEAAKTKIEQKKKKKDSDDDW